MADNRSAERARARAPVMRIEMISGRKLDQFFAAGKSMRQFVEKIEAAHDESRADKKHRASKNREHDPHIEARIMERITVELRRGLAGEPVVAQKNQDARDDDQRDEADHAIKQDRE